MHGCWTDAFHWRGIAGLLLQGLGELTHTWPSLLADLSRHTRVTADSRHGKTVKSLPASLKKRGHLGPTHHESPPPREEIKRGQYGSGGLLLALPHA
eukprot:1143916-Pelagomonas_calceolata.AAC.2